MIQAYLFALTTHFVSKLLADLQFSFFGPEAMLKVFQPKEVDKPDQLAPGPVAKVTTEAWG